MSVVIVTAKQSAILLFIRAHSGVYGFPPTNQEIASHFGFTSINAAVDHVQRLTAKGCIEKTKGKARSVTLTKAGYTAVIGPVRRGPGRAKAKEPVREPA